MIISIYGAASVIAGGQCALYIPIDGPRKSKGRIKMGAPPTRTSVAFIMRMPRELLEALREESGERKMPVSAIVMEALGEDRMPLGRATPERLLKTAAAAEARKRRQKAARALAEEQQRRRSVLHDEQER